MGNNETGKHTCPYCGHESSLINNYFFHLEICEEKDKSEKKINYGRKYNREM